MKFSPDVRNNPSYPEIKLCVIKLNETYLILPTKAFVGDERIKTPPVGETSAMHSLYTYIYILISTNEGQDCFLITDRFQAFRALCSSLDTFSVSFHISELMFICMDSLGYYQHLVNISYQQHL